MDQRQDSRAGDDRMAAERTVRTGISEIQAELERLERTARQGKITASELEEVRDVLTLQQRRLGTS
jgi:hypothetical protein